ncbi:hypothetical protein [Thalassoglobus neptunius]|uniref:hypothetical protein n=1 Tax=Thalassoglobus neptunius TaxID=1938619 RepID=UPI0011B5E0ED|nr:hypothetical protein [Thalassoglobus neptunius]
MKKSLLADESTDAIAKIDPLQEGGTSAMMKEKPVGKQVCPVFRSSIQQEFESKPNPLRHCPKETL